MFGLYFIAREGTAVNRGKRTANEIWWKIQKELGKFAKYYIQFDLIIDIRIFNPTTKISIKINN